MDVVKMMCSAGLWLLPAVALAADYHVAPDGTPEGAGTEDDPWDLATGLAGGEGRPGPGDTVWLAPGEYAGGVEVWAAGTADAPLVIRGATTERTTVVSPVGSHVFILDHADNTTSHHVWFRDFEVRGEVVDRVDEDDPAGDLDIEMGGGLASSRADGLHFINLVVHDTAQGFSLYNESWNAVVYGCLVYNNGWEGPNRGHGHGLYSHNSDVTQPKQIHENIFLSQVGLLAQAYGTQGHIRGYRFTGNVFVDGVVILGGASGAEVEDIVFDGNFGYDFRGSLGYNGGFEQNLSLTANDNYIGGHFQVSSSWQSLEMLGNVFSMTTAPMDHMIYRGSGQGGSEAGWAIDDNTYYAPGETIWLEHGNDWFTLAEMQDLSGHDLNSTHVQALPEPRVEVRSNDYDGERGHIIVFNWDDAPTVDVDLSGLGWGPGDTVRIRNARSYYDDFTDHVLDGGPLAVSMVDRADLPLPVGLDEPTGGLGGAPIFPTFGVFVAERIEVGAPPGDDDDDDDDDGDDDDGDDDDAGEGGDASDESGGAEAGDAGDAGPQGATGSEGADEDAGADEDSAGCACSSGRGPAPTLAMGLGLLLLMGPRRSRRRRPGTSRR